jgi:aminoglycoside 6-adenylyltransferase
MNPRYRETIDRVSAWAAEQETVQAAVALGSQVRRDLPGDEWSDLDVLLLVDDPQIFLRSDDWLAFLGEVACAIVEETPLDWVRLTWAVKRVLFADGRAVDFSILPAGRVDDVLAMNAEIHANGYQVLYDAQPGLVASKIEASLAGLKTGPAGALTEAELRQMVDCLLFQLIWAGKKIKRGELWVAVSGINQTINLRLLGLIEAFAASTHPLRYEGRFLERRVPPELLAKLPGCFAGYDERDAIRAIGDLVELTVWLAQGICAKNHYPFDEARFDTIRALYWEMFGSTT